MPEINAPSASYLHLSMKIRLYSYSITGDSGEQASLDAELMDGRKLHFEGPTARIMHEFLKAAPTEKGGK